jgi:serine O-acetyltransferase
VKTKTGKTTDWIDTAISEVAGRLTTCNRCHLRRKNKQGEYCLPSRKAVHDVLDTLMGILFPGCHGHGPVADRTMASDLRDELKATVTTLQQQVEMALEYGCETDEDCGECKDCNKNAAKAVKCFVSKLPEIQMMLQADIEAAYDGDPAAKSTMEVVMSYPAVQAITTYRIAHLLYEAKVPLIPRIMTELAHSRTGIDIHPGAEIDERFFIDHGTGVVIGETTVIGKNVKLYQGVTLGALSFPEGEDGKPIKGIKRHPNVGDNVTIYAEATLLGDITIGEGSEIGGNVWLTHSVPPHSQVHNVQPNPRVV